MAIDNLTLVRKRIGDNTKTHTEVIPIGENNNTVQLTYGNVTIFSLYDQQKSTAVLQESVDYIVNSPTGTITLQYQPIEDSELVAVYSYFAFSDEELEELINAYGINGACTEAIRWLIADSSRLHDYSRGATTESLSQVVKNLQDMLKDYSTIGSNADGSPTDMTVLKRTNQWYRGTIPVQTDLSRDDSLN